ncbi:MAG TPA: DUF4124 domain-containing protein [Ectothiorhodospiraceae bacterium]|nr:DUF4124 domain-containing protein [Ectothiorhodospiraceae bacterium]
MAKIVLLLLFTLTITVAPSAYSATIYKWTDKSGQTHYTRTPPPKSMTDAKVESQNSDKVPAARVEEAPKSNPIAEQSTKQTPLTTEPSVEEKHRQQLCQSAQSRLNEMRRTDRVTENGHEIEITEDELLRRLDELNEIVKENCTPYKLQPAQPAIQQPAPKTVQPAIQQPAPKAVQKSVPQQVQQPAPQKIQRSIPQPQLPLEKRPEQKMVNPPPQSIPQSIK